MGFLLFVLVILCIAYSIKMGGNDTFKTFKLDEPMVLISYALLGTIIIVGVQACCTSFTMNKCCACITVVLLFSLTFLLCIIAGALFVPGMYGEQLVTEGCAAIKANNIASLTPV